MITNPRIRLDPDGTLDDFMATDTVDPGPNHCKEWLRWILSASDSDASRTA